MKTLLLAYLASVAAAVCHHGTTLWVRDFDPPSFGYTGKIGPLEWHNISPKNQLCALGKHQSPIDIEPEADYIKTVDGRAIEFHLEDYLHGAEFENLGTTMEVPANGSIKRDGKEYKLKQFHFHASGEHRIREEMYPMEVHFVFQAADESVAVVGIMIEVSYGTHTASPFLTAVLDKSSDIPNGGDVTHTYPLLSAEIERHVSKCSIYQYSGSLTTPPCSEGIAWNVVTTPLYISASTYKAAKEVLRFNARYTQNPPGEENLLVEAARGIVQS